MIFDADYWHNLDRKEEEKVTLNPSQLGYSLGDMGGRTLQNLKTGIFLGANAMELTFFNSPGKGQGKNTPESYGKEERQEMKELARINEVEVSTHATPNMQSGGASFSGFTGQGFSSDARDKAITEMKRALDFAADVSEGGPVVFHLDGFPRRVSSAGLDNGEMEGRFRKYPQEEQRDPIQFVDTTTGQVQSVPQDLTLAVPERKKDGLPDEFAVDENGDYIIENRKVGDILREYEGLGAEDKKELKEKYDVENEYGYLMYQQGSARLGEYTADEYRYREQVKELKKEERKINQQIEAFGNDEINKEALKEYVINELQPRVGRYTAEEYEKIINDPLDHLKEKQKEIEANRQAFESGAVSFARQRKQTLENLKNQEELTEYGVRQEADTIARTGIEALKIEKEKNLKDPLWVAPENYLVEMYGSHPDEYRKIIQGSRDRMVDLLTQKQIANPQTGEKEDNEYYQGGLSKTEAKKIAEDHIRGTFDIGHANMWRKYHTKGDKDFRKWMEKNVKGLVKDKIIGHVHISDNFGFHDEHIEIGAGNAPMQEFFKALKEEGYEGQMVAEPGGQREGMLHRVWTSALELGGSPVYRIDGSSKDWTDIGGSYFGRTQSPNFVVGDYRPSEDWTLWSGTPLE